MFDMYPCFTSSIPIAGFYIKVWIEALIFLGWGYRGGMGLEPYGSLID